tara:strand:+ start:3901 stop:4260 length:360 start_codon:yes stop_codon:yes gene_type:complete
MAGTVTTTEKAHTSAKKIVFAWTSSAGGAADATTTERYDGKIVGLTTDPGAAAPTDDYDVVITDEDGHDVLLGAGANRDTANTEHVDGDSLAAVADSVLTLAVTNAGNAKGGEAIVWVR